MHSGGQCCAVPEFNSIYKERENNSLLYCCSHQQLLECETTVTVLHIIFRKKTADDDKIVNRQEVGGNYIARDEVVPHFQ